MNVLEKFTDKENNTHEIIYVKNIHETEYKDWFLESCKEIVNNGHALEIWDYKLTSFHSIIWLKNKQPFLHFSFIPNKHYGLLVDLIIYASPQGRKLKYTLKMMEIFKQWAKKNNYTGTCGLIHTTNKRSLEFCKRAGFKMPFYFAILDFN